MASRISYPLLRLIVLCFLWKNQLWHASATLFDRRSQLRLQPRGAQPKNNGDERSNKNGFSHYKFGPLIKGGHQQDPNDQAGETTPQEQQQQAATDHHQSSHESSSSSADSTAPTNGHQQQQQQGRHWLFGTRSKLLKKVPYQGMAAMKNRMQHRVGQFTSSAKTMIREHQENSDGGSILDKKERFLSALGPSVLAVWASRGGSSNPQRLLSFGTIYALSLLGASVGFYSFLYFISVGYALGIILPLVAVMTAYLRLPQHGAVKVFMGLSTLVHSGLVVVWGLRALVFFLWREYCNWPALHKQIRHVNESSAPTLPVKCLIWIMYSFLYTAMLSPCWFRLQQSARMVVAASTTVPTVTRGFHPFRWLAACLPILLQLTGLSLESVADYQKSTFKLHNRYEWCHIGLWKWSTHPNYLGEMIFWTGTYLGWILFTMVAATSAASLSSSLLSWVGQCLFCTLGYGFITTVLRGSIQSMSNKHWQKYGHIPEYATFRQSHGLTGPKRRHLSAPTADVTPGQQQQQQEDLANTASTKDGTATNASPAPRTQ